jgi:hypothetical protein
VIYTTEEQAFRRAETVRLQGKWWPGVIRHRDGTFELTYDPLEDAGMLTDGLTGPGSGNRQGFIREPRPQFMPRTNAPYPGSIFTSRSVLREKP